MTSAAADGGSGRSEPLREHGGKPGGGRGILGYFEWVRYGMAPPSSKGTGVDSSGRGLSIDARSPQTSL